MQTSNNPLLPSILNTGAIAAALIFIILFPIVVPVEGPTLIFQILLLLLLLIFVLRKKFSRPQFTTEPSFSLARVSSVLVVIILGIIGIFSAQDMANLTAFGSGRGAWVPFALLLLWIPAIWSYAKRNLKLAWLFFLIPPLIFIYEWFSIFYK